MKSFVGGVSRAGIAGRYIFRRERPTTSPAYQDVEKGAISPARTRRDNAPFPGRRFLFAQPLYVPHRVHVGLLLAAALLLPFEHLEWSFFRTELREQDDVPDGGLVGKEHDETVDADAFACCRRHAVFERAQKIFIEIMCFFITRLALYDLRFESFTLIERIVQLREGVGNLTAGDVELEAIRQRRI